jgi:hypothetical protein
MSIPDAKEERLTEFERAVCFDTLPQVTRPVTLGAIAAYAAILAVAMAVLVYGVRAERAAWKAWGAAAVGIVVAGGLLGFTVRATANAVRRRAALAEAGGVPNVESGFDDLPDPFAGHALLRFYREGGAGPKVVTGNRGEAIYTAESRESGGAWDVLDPAGERIFRVEAAAPSRSFSFDAGTPSALRVLRGDDETARVVRRWSLGPGRVEITGTRQPAKPLVFRAGGLFEGEVLVGRIYSIRNYLYLDVKQGYVDDGLLAFYFCMLG